MILSDACLSGGLL